MLLLSVLRNILNQPLNRNRKLAALGRFGRWQLGSRLYSYPIAINFVNDSRLLAARGMTGASGNIYGGLAEFEDMSFLLHLLRPKDLFIDVGANIGAYTILAGAAVGCRCHAIEPIPETFERLLDNVYLNRINDRVIAHNIGAASEKGVLRFSSGLDTTNHVISDGTSELEYVEVEVRRLDDIVGNDALVMIKIDVEGFEASVLEGSRALLERRSLLAIVMESNLASERYGFDERAPHELLVGSYDFQPVQYDPLKREVARLDIEARTSDNIIYVRELETVLTRLQSAPKFSVLGQLI